MRLLNLHLQAFGPFTNCWLDLSAGREGLHIIHGPNEAGKSSALRALHGLLFGIPERSRDDFLHRSRDLRIGARLCARDGREWEGYRRKGRKNTLLGADQGADTTTLPENQLHAMLGGIDAETFRRLFGIDHQSLVSGGEELLAEHGAAADALFGAGMGRLNLRTLAQQLDSEAHDIFRPQATKPLLNQELAHCRELERALKTRALGARDWAEAAQRLTEAEQELNQLTAEILRAETQRSQLERVRRTQPLLARVDELNHQLTVLGDCPNLPEDFSQRRQQAERQLQESAAQRAAIETRLARLRQQSAELSVDDRLLIETDAIEALTEALGSYRKAARDRPGLVAQRDAEREQAARILTLARPGLSLEQADSLRPLLTRQRATQQLASEGARLKTAATLARKSLRDLQQQLAQREAHLAECPTPPPSEALEEAVSAARRAGDLDRQIAELTAEAANLQRQAERSLAAAGYWQQDLLTLCQAVLPNASQIQTFIDREQELTQQAGRIADALADTRAERARSSERLRALRLGGEIPTEAQLAATRAQRDALWQRIKTWCFGGPHAAGDYLEIPAHQIPGEAGDSPLSPNTEDNKAPLSERFETSQNTADRIADRLRREAASVHEQAAIQARLEQTQAQEADLARAATARDAQAEALNQEWLTLWSALDIKPGTPTRMRDWRAQVRPLIEQAEQREKLARRLRGLEQERARLTLALTLALTPTPDGTSEGNDRASATLIKPPGKPVAPVEPRDPGAPTNTSQPRLGPLLRQAERALGKLQDQARDHARLSDACQEHRARARQLQAESCAADQDLADWQERWQTLLAELKLPDARDAEAVAEDFERLAGLFAALDRQAGLDARIQAIDADANAFTQHAHALLARLTPIPPAGEAQTLAALELEPALGQLRQRLAREREARSRRDELNSQRQQAEQDLAQVEDSQAGARATLQSLCKIAKCSNAEELAAVEARARQRQECQSALTAVQSELREAGDGRALAELRTEVQAFASDALSATRNSLEQQLKLELRPRERAAIERKLAAQQALAAMDGSAQAADLASQIAQSRARCKRLARQWLQRRFAARLLQDARDRFAERHRDPLLPRIADYFARLTDGAFRAVEIDFDQSGPPVLVARRASGERLDIDALSTGTRDQLYLALRLATLEQRATQAEPLPLIVDDILVQFDDRRSRATLSALAEFSAHTQVILFTHHRYVVEQAQALASSAQSASGDEALEKITQRDVAARIFVHDLCENQPLDPEQRGKHSA
ncbi:chromosome segregation protein [Thiorhodovibrio winogradskyi]|uniref:Chromosome segregation protein n=1 Tax=Thiorhodovibrio winogradskyi TaxID=77007 RepID=A0ABZ0S3I3_9GAMM|nr:AAA family ATPase [Thiorhodovibrio winogradskyi]